MALRKRGKAGFYHAYFKTVMSTSDGNLKYANRTVNLYTTDLVTARALEAELMNKNRAVRFHQRTLARMIQMEVEAGERPPEDVPVITREKRKRRLKISDALEAAGKYRVLGETTKKHFRAFVKTIGFRYMDEITPDIAFDYLIRKYPDNGNGKSFNNIKSALNTVFRMTLIDSGLDVSPFSKIPNRTLAPKHQRPFTEEEFVRIHSAASEPWKTAVLIAWFTGLRKKDVFQLCWKQIDGDVLTTTPAKTARFGRAVQIPLHSQLMEVLRNIPRKGERVFGKWSDYIGTKPFNEYFPALLARLDITENIHGIVNFNSFRDSFVTRCDAAGIPRHAIRGIVGHTDDNITDLYSHDLTTARLVQHLPSVKLG